MKTIHFMAGLPRSGSTVLAAILSQHPMMQVTNTSGMVFTHMGLLEVWKKENLLPDSDQLIRSLRGLMTSFYETESKPIVMDKSRA
jgi:sulfotransferase